MLKEFKQFIFKGDVVALSTGVLIGASFGKIVDAFTKGVVDPLLRKFGGNPNVSLGWEIGKFQEPIMEKGEPLKNAAGEIIMKTSPNMIDLGLIINAALAFLITAAIIFFLIVKPSQKLLAIAKKEEAAAPPPEPTNTEKLLAEIRDSLKK
jgi:large conductance mechanosensitive channel